MTGLPASAAASEEPSPRGCRTLRMLHHGREVHDVALLPGPPGPGGGPWQPAEAAVVTAGEDGSVRRALCGRDGAGQQVQAASFVSLLVDPHAKDATSWRDFRGCALPGAQGQGMH